MQLLCVARWRQRQQGGIGAAATRPLYSDQARLSASQGRLHIKQQPKNRFILSCTTRRVARGGAAVLYCMHAFVGGRWQGRIHPVPMWHLGAASLVAAAADAGTQQTAWAAAAWCRPSQAAAGHSYLSMPWPREYQLGVLQPRSSAAWGTQF